ncbi:hypothetical protein GXP67_28770 [Rhodocytophaga rosea]|uniref:Uncharacterized protein n=1 Tax=Rhodocytophaga rosea TaxID=2704465 RepID=A0A6C0GQL0_9BACT|nr:hypothetical protein [Rhodocytophaga rosea]QHT70365.1 hypothetical protein GXP67_28770 [Rhodocytophaga rosea]
MNRRTLIRVGIINLIVGVLIVSPFLPGPSFLSTPINFISSSIQFLSIPALVVSLFGLVGTIMEVKKVSRDKTYKIGARPLLMLTLPIFSFLTVIWLSDFARTYSRETAIGRATPLIIAVEKYNRDKGYYPVSLDQLKKESYLKFIPSPWIMGVAQYQYQPTGDSYRVSFSQNVIMGFNFEIVTYDKNDSHKAEGELETLYVTNTKHWKYYIYD